MYIVYIEGKLHSRGLELSQLMAWHINEHMLKLAEGNQLVETAMNSCYS